MKSDIPRLVLDANIMISAVMGRSFSILLALLEAGVVLMAPVQQLAETRAVLKRRPALPSDWIDAQMMRLLQVVVPLNPAMFDEHEVAARTRLQERGQSDWPVLAASLATGSAIWSHDKDFFGSGAAVWSTRILIKQIGLQNV